MEVLLVLFVAFAAGIASGRLLHAGPTLQRVVARVQTAGILALVFLMGLALGADATFWERVGRLGLEALLFGVLTAAGGGFAAMLAGRWIERRRLRAADAPAGPIAPASPTAPASPAAPATPAGGDGA